MAMKHRKLFPTQTATNQSVDCLDFCDSTCPYNCYIYPDSLIPPPPPASPRPPTLSTLDQNDSPNISPYVIITVALLAGFFLLVCFNAIIVKYCCGWRRRNRSPPSESDGRDEEFLDENRGPAIDHPIWFITTAGLQQAIINSITVCKYKRGEGLIEGTECSVCLSEFQEDETLRLLPKCNHAFHIPCIDTWLSSHTNCPLCRARIISDIVNPPLESNDQNSRSLGPNEQTQMENSSNDTELDNNLVRSRGVYESTVGRGGTGELQILDDERTSKEGVNSNGDVVLEVNGNSANNHVVDSEIQPVRRSVSMDSSSAATIFFGLAKFHADESKGNWVDETMDGRKFDSGSVPKRDVAYTSTFRQMGSPSIAQCLHKGPISMKRSNSCGGRFFLPRHNRSTNAILPL
ncbi:hypothetical protein VitviT2T_027258 [Vitis vinifera]|uniref:RING-type E3 ubiquitin transferase n=1 Tax=Vitis vinifera TaxID=29760 RepID=A0ABY9DQ21_VITVI|nr:RING-H2 finger protein ATL54 [Vitis vinifera]WKA09633.1 hypothetical protein VitviT2T_027258 [Vitis vinifera]|eukprot:XP_003634417.1 PREDICTED: RING-H2 finger protein ATL54 [Vitis vinifera]